MDPIDYAVSQSMGVFTSALRLLPIVLRLAMRVVIFILPFALAAIASAIASLVGFAWGLISIMVVGIRSHGKTGIDVEGEAKRRVLNSPTFIRYFGVRDLNEPRYPGDDQMPGVHFDLMAVLVPGQWIRFAFSLYRKCANGALEVGLLLGSLALAVLDPVIGGIKKWKMKRNGH